MADRHGGERARREIRLDFSVNVNPYGLPEGVRAALADAIGAAERYPEPDYRELREAIAQAERAAPTSASEAQKEAMEASASEAQKEAAPTSASEAQKEAAPASVGKARAERAEWASAIDQRLRWERILVGNGASELIVAAAHAYAGARVLLQQPLFSGYERAFTAAGCGLGRLAMTPDFRLSDEAPAQISAERPALVVLCQPGNPVGAMLPAALLQEIAAACREVGAALLVDECFLGFVERSGERSTARLLLTDAEEDILILRAFTKLYAMPGVRLGYLICGRDKSAERIAAQLPEWNVSAAAEAAGRAALLEERYAAETAAALRQERAWLAGELERLGFTVYDGEANFIFFQSRVELWEPLLRRGILIRRCDNYAGIPAEGYYRAAVRRRAENEALLRALRDCIGEGGERG